MTRVIIQPSFGSADARRHWADTLEHEVVFVNPPFATALTSPQLDLLTKVHSAGAARFWGATSNHDAKMSTLSPGDVVLFTGGKMVRAVGEVAVSLRNPDLADHLWDPHPDRGSYVNIYSLSQFETTEITYDEIWDLPGFNAGDNFMGLRFLDEFRSAAILDGLRITTNTSLSIEAAHDTMLASALASGKVIDQEAVNVTSTSYEPRLNTTFVNRAEAVLVKAYVATLNPGLDVGRLSTPVGITDLYIGGVDAEIVEAKSTTTHGHVRQALAQLLDYVVHAPHGVASLAALFPSDLDPGDVALLHRYGIDVVTRQPDGRFLRAPASDSQLQAMTTIWTS